MYDELHEALLDRQFDLTEVNEEPSSTYFYERSFECETLRLKVALYEGRDGTDVHLRYGPSVFSSTLRLQQEPLNNANALLDSLDERLRRLDLDERSFCEACADHSSAFAFLFEHTPDYVQEHGLALAKELEPFDGPDRVTDLLLSLHRLPDPGRVAEALKSIPGGFTLSDEDARTVAGHGGDLVVEHDLRLQWDRQQAYLSALRHGQHQLLDRLEQQLNTHAIPTEAVLEVVLDSDGSDLRGAVNRFRKNDRLRNLATVIPVGRFLREEAPKTYRASQFYLLSQLAMRPELARLRQPDEALRLIHQNGFSTDSRLLGRALEHGWHDEVETIIHLYDQADCVARIEPDLAMYHADDHGEGFENAWQFLFANRDEPGLDVSVRVLFELGLDDREAFRTLLDEWTLSPQAAETVYRSIMHDFPEWIEDALEAELTVPDSLSSALIEAVPEHEERIIELSEPRRIEPIDN